MSHDRDISISIKTAEQQQDAFHLLLIEDEPADAHLVKLALQESRLNIVLQHLPDAIKGLAYLRREPPCENTRIPDLILLDLNMPGMMGQDFLLEIKADPQLKSIPVVVLTTSDAESDIRRCYQLGASGYISKPIDIDQFIRVIKSLGDYWINVLKTPGSHG